MPTNIDATVLAATSGGKVFSNKDIWLTFNTDGTVNYKEGSAGVWQNNVSLTALAPNKVIAVDKGNLHVKGIVSGKVTIAATQSSGMGNGNIYIDDDITYKNSPASLSCPDMLGIVASNNVIISDLPANKGDVTIHGTMFCNKGGLSVENYNKIGYCGAIRLTGGLIESQSQATGVWSGSSVTSGYNERFTYDPRFMIDGPPAFPATGSYEILSWLE
jgi:hypothetical protein